MHLPSALLGGLLLINHAAATPGQRPRRAVCNGDNLYRCFLSSTSLASQYCLSSMTLPGTTDTVYVTPTVTSTSTVTVAGVPQSVFKRAATTSKPLACTTYPASRLSSACSCIGITAAVYSETVTLETVTVPAVVTSYVSPTSAACPAPVTATETVTQISVQTQTQIQTQTETQTQVQTQTQIDTQTQVQTQTETETQTQTGTETQTQTQTETQTQTQTQVQTQTQTDTQTQVQTQTETQTRTRTWVETITLVKTSVTTSIEVTTVTATATAAASPCPAAAGPIVKNGNFESGNYDGWSNTANVGRPVLSVVSGGVGGAYTLDLFTSYFTNNAVAALTVTQSVSCTAGAKYRFNADIALISSYNNNNPWSILIDSQTVVSGAGSALAWNTVTYTFTCSGGAALISIKLQSSANRQAHFQVDNVIVTPLSIPN